MLKYKVLDTIKEHNLICDEDNIAIGVSGGPDSMALLYILLEIKALINFNIYIIHVNHGVRGKDAEKDQLFVKRIAEELNLPYYTKSVNMIEYGKKMGITAEEAGRELRYGFFREVLNAQGGGKIAVAHNLNDQAETLIMRFFRGTGIDGLKGMEFITGDIIRPILGISREEIESYIEDNNIETVLDETNLQPIYTRNKVRLELIPYIEENFNPNIINTLWRMSQISAVDSKFLEGYSKKGFNLIVKNEDENGIILDGKKLLEEDQSIQQRVLRISIERVNDSLQGISKMQISNILDLLNKFETGKEVHISNNIIAKISYGDLIIKKNTHKKDDKYLHKLKLPGITNLQDINYSFDIQILPIEEISKMYKDNNIGYFDYDIIKGDLSVRNRKDGDRFMPFGMKGTKKLKDYLIDEKIPNRLRNGIPLIVDQRNILWVVGYRTNEMYKVTKDTKKVLKIVYNLLHNT